jgi:hypothetical protein
MRLGLGVGFGLNLDLDLDWLGCGGLNWVVVGCGEFCRRVLFEFRLGSCVFDTYRYRYVV